MIHAGLNVGFLQSGRYPSLATLLLRLECAATSPPRPASYSHMTRELLWSTWSDRLHHLVPVLERAARLLPRWTGPTAARPASPGQCGECAQVAVLVCHAHCGHTFCYYCAAVLLDRGRPCPVCSASLATINIMADIT